MPQLSLTLLLIGLAGIAGTWPIRRLLRRHLLALLIGIPLVMAGLPLITWQTPVAVAGLLFLWGFFATAAPVGWGTWLAHTMGDDAEAGGRLQVATIQLAIMSGAAVGGLIIDAFGWQANFGMAAVLLVRASIAASRTWKNLGAVK